jgi:hypothetical protein
VTHGINVMWEHARVHFDVWGFGGQREYTHTHPIFYSVRCAFLVAWNPRMELSHKAITSSLRYFLNRIDSHAAAAPTLMSSRMHR